MSLFGQGRPFAQTVALPGPPDAVRQQLFIAATGVQGYTVVQTGPNSMSLQRRFIPTWALVLAGVGFFFFFLGLLFLLVRNTETAEIRLGPAGGSTGTKVGISGVADSEMMNRLQGVLLGGQQIFDGQPGPVPGNTAAPQRLMSPDGTFWWDGNTWHGVT